MSYSEIEQSVQDGQPVELYEFAYQNQYFRYCSGDTSVVHSGNTYLPVPLMRGSIENSNDPNELSVEVKVPADSGIALIFHTQPPSSVVTLTVYRKHISDPDGQYIVAWLGRTLNCSISGNVATLHNEPALSSLKRSALRRRYQLNCPYSLYHSGCKLVADLFRTTVTNFTVVGNVVFCQDMQLQPDNWFAGGFISYENKLSGVIEQMSIRSSSAGNLYLILTPTGLAEADLLHVYPGCDHTVLTCKNKFSNLHNFGGFPFIPVISPFGGTQIF